MLNQKDPLEKRKMVMLQARFSLFCISMFLIFHGSELSPKMQRKTREFEKLSLSTISVQTLKQFCDVSLYFKVHHVTCYFEN
jgi:hypothetical protein